MKTNSIYLALALAVALTGCNRSADERSSTTQPTPATAPAAPAAAAMPATATAEGTVESADAAKGTITIAHDPVPALNWPGMTMPFKATAEQIAAVKAGDRIEFDFDTKDYVLSRVSVKQ